MQEALCGVKKKNLHTEGDLEKPLWKGFFSAKEHWQLPPSSLKCWVIRVISLSAAGFLLQTLGLVPLSVPGVTTPVFHWDSHAQQGFSVTFAAVPGR